jgi:hypothetical protein
MSVASSTSRRLRVAIAIGLGCAGLPSAHAARPSTTIGLVAPSWGEVGAGRYVSGGGRGGRFEGAAGLRRATRDDAPAPATRAATSPRDGCLLAAAHEARRRPTESRAMPPPTAADRPRLVRVVDVAHGPCAPDAAGVFHDAHAPPAPATDVARPLA